MRLCKISTVFIAFFLMCGLSSAKVVALSLEEMVSRSEVIIVGRVIKIEETGIFSKDLTKEYRAIVEAEEVIKGNASGAIEIYFYPKVSIEPKFSVDERCILFVNTREGKNGIVQGYGGKVLIQDDKVEPSMIGEEKIQGFTHFKNRIIAHTR